ncbi:hypothetical protein FBUS_04340 [Fasciolopsis buskii]|uniref:Uncharacterized protein n=1 Tax=Fasciolopsis buskii TaxID=27845 RepID=A0A8E0VJT3_9TREM|nr:hypothetical protein FBUS_04340 [Fasciolopsis buski]
MFSAGSIDLAETTNVNESYRVLYSNEKMELVRTNTVSGAYAYGCDFGPKIRRDLYVSQERFVNEIRNLSEMRADTDVTEGCFIRHTGFTLIGCAITADKFNDTLISPPFKQMSQQLKLSIILLQSKYNDVYPASVCGLASDKSRLGQSTRRLETFHPTKSKIGQV